MIKKPIEILTENLRALELSAKKLLYSFEQCGSTGIKGIYTEDEFIAFEAMTSRYARTTDMLVNKVLRSIDAVEYIDSGTIIDVMNTAEKRGIADAEKLRELKDLRNSIAHEYQTDNIERFFELVLASTPFLLSVINNTFNYARRYTDSVQ